MRKSTDNCFAEICSLELFLDELSRKQRLVIVVQTILMPNNFDFSRNMADVAATEKKEEEQRKVSDFIIFVLIVWFWGFLT